MLLTVYTPLNTTAARLYVDREQVIFLNDFQSTAWRGKPSELVGSLSAFGNGDLPLLLVGLPASGMNIAYWPAGIQSVQIGDATVSFQPPSYPPKVVSIDRAGTHVEIEHVDSFVDPNPIEVPAIPADYRCCVLPQV